MAQFEAITSAAFENLLSVTKDVGSRLFLDISEHLELSSLPNSNGVLKYLAGKTLPSHAAILCGLVKNQVYSDLEVAFAISEDAAVYKALSQTVELLEGHTSMISQHYYGCLFHELLAFQIADRHPQQERQPAEVIPQKMIGFSSSAISTLKTLQSCGWDVASGCGGISMLAKPAAYIGKAFKVDGFEGKLDGCNIREAILRATGLCINSSSWTGIPDYCRFSFALEKGEFERAMGCITRLKELVLGGNAQAQMNGN